MPRDFEESQDLRERLLAEIRELFGGAPGVELPPPVFREMDGRFHAYEEGESMEISYGLRDRYAGPSGVIQGGILAAAFDNTYGPFSYLLARTFTTTVSFTTAFMRPIFRRQERVWIRASKVEKTRRFLFLEGEAYNPEGKLVATNQAQMLMVPMEEVARMLQGD